MLTPQDVRSVQFEKNLRGYRTEDVDRFLDKIEEQLQQDDAQAEQLRKQIADLTAENQRLHRELQSYEADGEMLKSALINAQRMGESVIREANQKAEETDAPAGAMMLPDGRVITGKTSSLLGASAALLLNALKAMRDANELLQKASDRADEIESEANDKRLAEEREYDRVRLEVTRFKSDVLNLYRSHVESLSRLPEFQKDEKADADKKAADEPAEPAAEESVEDQAAVQQPEAEAPAQEPDTAGKETDSAADAEDDKAAESSEDFWEKDESQLKLDPPADAKPDGPDYDAFQGVKFSE